MLEDQHCKEKSSLLVEIRPETAQFNEAAPPTSITSISDSWSNKVEVGTSYGVQLWRVRSCVWMCYTAGDARIIEFRALTIAVDWISHITRVQSRRSRVDCVESPSPEWGRSQEHINLLLVAILPSCAVVIARMSSESKVSKLGNILNTSLMKCVFHGSILQFESQLLGKLGYSRKTVRLGLGYTSPRHWFLPTCPIF